MLGGGLGAGGVSAFLGVQFLLQMGAVNSEIDSPSKISNVKKPFSGGVAQPKLLSGRYI